jgi:hypothetical protein
LASELCISGYGCNIIVAVGLALLYQNRVYNTVCLLSNGIHYELRWFHSWVSDAYIEINRHIHFNCGGVRIGFEITNIDYYKEPDFLDQAYQSDSTQDL